MFYFIAFRGVTNTRLNYVANSFIKKEKWLLFPAEIRAHGSLSDVYNFFFFLPQAWNLQLKVFGNIFALLNKNV